MIYNLEFALRVAYDINKAYAWYEKQKPGLGVEFISEIEDCYKKLELHPESYSHITKQRRLIKTPRFPYLIIYRIHRNNVFISRVLHTNRMKK